MVRESLLEATFDGAVFVPDQPVTELEPGSHVRIRLEQIPAQKEPLLDFLKRISADLPPHPPVDVEKIDRGDLY
jgi:hypothetical protein